MMALVLEERISEHIAEIFQCCGKPNTRDRDSECPQHLFPVFLDSPLIFARVILIDNREARSRVIHAERSVTWEYRRPSNFDSVLYFVSRYVIHRVLSKQSIVPVSLCRCDRSTQLRFCWA